MNLWQMAERVRSILIELNNYAYDYTERKEAGHKTKRLAILIRRRIESLGSWLDSIERQLEEDEQESNS